MAAPPAPGAVSRPRSSLLTPPTMPAHAPAAGTLRWALPLLLACTFAATLPFPHLSALRAGLVSLAALVTFVVGGWRDAPSLPLVRPALAWGAVAALSVFFATHRAESLTELRLEVAYPFLAFSTWYVLGRRANGARWLGRVLVLGTIVVVGGGIAQRLTGRPWHELGSYGDVGLVSTYLVTALPVFLLMSLRSPPHTAARIGALALATGCLVAGALTLNRMFWFAAAAEIVVFALFSVRLWDPRRRLASMLVVGTLVAGLALLQVVVASESRLALFAPGTGVWEFLADDPRGELWQFAAARIAEHPWIGAGIGKWTSREAFIAEFHDPLLMHAHNAFLNRALETGLPGLVAFTALLASVGLAYRRIARSGDADTAAIGAAGLALLAGVVVKNLTDDVLVQQNALLFWSLIAAGLGTAAARAERALGAVTRR
jgi:O-antigen ligase